MNAKINNEITGREEARGITLRDDNSTQEQSNQKQHGTSII